MAEERTVSERAPKWDGTLLDGMRALGDPVADEAVAAVLNSHDPGQASELFQAMVRAERSSATGLPRELDDYFEATASLPDWADLDQMARGQRLFEQWGVPISVCLFCASLPTGYAAAKSVQVLHLTARLETDPRRRIMETGQFFVDVLTPGALRPAGDGRRVIQRVRLMHAVLRHLIRARSSSDPGLWEPSWGLPINQEDLAFTLQSFGSVVGAALPQLGVEIAPADADAYLHLWNVIGHQLGVVDQVLPVDVSDAGRLVAAIRERQVAATPEGAAMTAALVDLLEELTPLHRAEHYVPTLIRQLIGDATAELIGVPPGAPEGGPQRRWLGSLVRHGDSPIERRAWVQRLAEPFGRELLTAAFRIERTGERAPFAIPGSLASAWHLS